jgi:hypothetical protein
MPDCIIAFQIYVKLYLNLTEPKYYLQGRGIFEDFGIRKHGGQPT